MAYGGYFDIADLEQSSKKMNFLFFFQNGNNNLVDCGATPKQSTICRGGSKATCRKLCWLAHRDRPRKIATLCMWHLSPMDLKTSHGNFMAPFEAGMIQGVDEAPTTGVMKQSRPATRQRGLMWKIVARFGKDEEEYAVVE